MNEKSKKKNGDFQNMEPTLDKPRRNQGGANAGVLSAEKAS